MSPLFKRGFLVTVRCGHRREVGKLASMAALMSERSAPRWISQGFGASVHEKSECLSSGRSDGGPSRQQRDRRRDAPPRFGPRVCPVVSFMSLYVVHSLI